ncbi:MAG: CDP-alcohol phosphatidyltransferase family protein, partial [Candidatus Aenigmatarchaeota archaeon]
MTLYKKGDRFSGFSVRVGEIFSNFGLTPNQWTFLSIIAVLIGVWFITQYNFFMGATFILIAAFLDVVDGSVARVMGKASRRGAYLDTIVDRYVEAFIIFGLLLINLPSFVVGISFWLFAYFFGSIMTTYVKAAAKEKDLKK